MALAALSAGCFVLARQRAAVRAQLDVLIDRDVDELLASVSLEDVQRELLAR